MNRSSLIIDLKFNWTWSIGFHVYRIKYERRVNALGSQFSNCGDSNMWFPRCSQRERENEKICRVFQLSNISMCFSLSCSIQISLFYLHFHNTRFSAHTAEGKKTAIFRILWKRKPEKYFPNDCFSRRLCLHHARRIFPLERVNRKNKKYSKLQKMI